MDQSEKDALLEEAKRRYPMGTEFKCLVTRDIYTMPDNITFRFNGTSIYSYQDSFVFHQHYKHRNVGTWAEIVSKPEEEWIPKVGDWAVRTVENGGVHALGRVFQISGIRMSVVKEGSIEHMRSSVRKALPHEIPSTAMNAPEIKHSSKDDLMHLSNEDLLEFCRKKFPIGCKVISPVLPDLMKIDGHDPVYKYDLTERKPGDRQVWFRAGDKPALVYDERNSPAPRLAHIVGYDVQAVNPGNWSTPTVEPYTSENVETLSYESSEDMFKPSRTI